MTATPTVEAAAPLAVAGASRARVMALAAAMLGWLFDGVEMGLYPLVARPSLRALLGDGFEASFAWWDGIINASFLLGAAAGGVLFGWLGDRFGRVRAMTWAVAVYSIGSGLCCLVAEAWQLAALRAIGALGMGGEWALGVALVMEVFPARSRPLMAGLIGAAANLGFLLVALIGLALPRALAALDTSFAAIGMPETWRAALAADGGWRALMLVGAAPALLTVAFRLFVPESERWRHAAATQTKPRVREILAPGLRARTLLGAALAGVALLGTWATVQKLPSWAHRLSGGLDHARAYTQIASAIGASIGTVLAALIAARVGRRIAYLGLCGASIGMGAVFCFAGFAWGTPFLIAVALFGMVTAGFYGWLPLYLPELFPTRVRATGQGTCFNAGRVIAAGGTLASGWLLTLFHQDYALMIGIMCLIYLVGAALIARAPDTGGRLPE